MVAQLVVDGGSWFVVVYGGLWWFTVVCHC